MARLTSEEYEKMNRYADAIKTVFVQRVMEDMKENREGIHVSDLVYPCVRKAYFNKVYGHRGEDDIGQLTERELLTFWIGKKIHELPITAFHEVPVEYMGVKGTFDEAIFADGNFIIIDKKTSNKIPKSAYEHHKTQIRFYALMHYKTTGVKAKYGAVIYIQKYTGMDSPEVIKVFVFPIGDYEEIELTFMERYHQLTEALEKGKVPERVPSFMCNYCPWHMKCFAEGRHDVVLEGTVDE